MTFRNDASQKERAAILKNDLRTQTMQGRAVAELQMEERGRFARQANVTGATPATQYPQLPASSPWASDPLPPEPPLGFSVEEMDPVGEQFEVDRSRATISAAASHSGRRDDSATSASDAAQLAGAAPSQPKTMSSAPA